MKKSHVNGALHIYEALYYFTCIILFTPPNLAVCLVAQLWLTLCDPIDCSPPGSYVHGVLQARILEWVAMSSSRGSSQPRDQTQVSCIAGGVFAVWATREALENQYCPFDRRGYCVLEIIKWLLSVITKLVSEAGAELQPHDLFQFEGVFISYWLLRSSHLSGPGGLNQVST